MVTIGTETYRVITHQAEEGGYWGEVLELPGCVSQGETMDEFRTNIREAIDAVLAVTENPMIELYVESVPQEEDSVTYYSTEPSTRTVAV